MRYFLLSTFIFTLLFAGCTSTPEPNTANTKPANSNTAATNSNSPMATNKRPETATTNAAPTITPIVTGFYEALQKKDEAGAKKYLSNAAVKYWEDEAKLEKKPWLAYLTEMEDPINEKREVRNEQIDGNTAIAEIKGGSLGVWTKIKFVQENGAWKFASPTDSPEFEGISKSSNSSVS